MDTVCVYLYKCMADSRIDFIALNEGESSPNTAQLIVQDEFGKQLSNKKWLISTGYKAKLVVFKK